MAFDTYIDDRAMIPVLLAHDWMVWKDTWTDCHYETYMALKKMMRHNGNAVPMVYTRGISRQDRYLSFVSPHLRQVVPIRSYTQVPFLIL